MKPDQLTMIERLKEERADLYRLYQEHIEYEKRLDQLNGLPHLLPEEEVERKQIQKLKLHGMDKIVEILREYESTEQAS